MLLSPFVILHSSFAADAPAAAPKEPPPKILPAGDTRRDVAVQKHRGELLSYDPATRAGTFKSSADGVIISFTALPHVLCQHHGALGDMSDYRIGERLRFMLHEGEDGKWNRLGLVAEELEELVAHDEPYFVDKIDAAKGILICTRRNRAGDKIVWPGMVISTDKDTRYWREGTPDAKFADLAVGMPLFMKTHGGTGLMERTAWEVLMDKASVEHFKTEQMQTLRQRLTTEGLPGYIDSVTEKEVRLTLFPEVMSFILGQASGAKATPAQRALKPRQTVQFSLAGPERAAKGGRCSGKVTLLRPFIKNQSYICEVTIALDSPVPAEFKATAVARVWPLEAGR
ncbi:MAG: hypothetical protein ACKVY0_10215 [Prosthecobacter sp.]|uniref:hypothetical protein n=1 Tax=Prosthecobacter sp. TaxID=1965333 RepID=UPI003901B7E6